MADFDRKNDVRETEWVTFQPTIIPGADYERSWEFHTVVRSKKEEELVKKLVNIDPIFSKVDVIVLDEVASWGNPRMTFMRYGSGLISSLHNLIMVELMRDSFSSHDYLRGSLGEFVLELAESGLKKTCVLHGEKIENHYCVIGSLLVFRWGSNEELCKSSDDCHEHTHEVYVLCEQSLPQSKELCDLVDRLAKHKCNINVHLVVLESFVEKF